MQYYYALFKKTRKAIEVEFPDLKGCVTFGSNWEEALTHAEDALAGWLAHADTNFIKEPSKHDELMKLLADKKTELVPIAINLNTLATYKELKRFNVIFPLQTLNRIDAYRKKKGLKRSTFLQKAAEEYLRLHS